MARKHYRRPTKGTVDAIWHGYGDQAWPQSRDHIEAHGPAWLSDPERVGIRDYDLAIMLYGMGFSFTAPIDEVEIENVSGYDWTVTITQEDGRTIARGVSADELFGEGGYGLYSRLNLEDFSVTTDREYA